MEKVQRNSIDKKNGLKYSKNDKSSTLPRANMFNQSINSKPQSCIKCSNIIL